MTAAAASAAWRLRALRIRPPSPLLAGALILLLHGAFSLWRGVMIAPDSAAYEFWAVRLIESGFDYPALLREADTGFPAILYVLFATLAAFLRLLFGDGWALALVVLNLAAHVALGLMILRLTERVTRSPAAGWTGLLLYLGCHDLVMWVPFALSDATFVTLAFLIFTLAGARILGDAKGWLALPATAAAGVFFRPTGMVLLPDLAWALFLARSRNAVQRPGRLLLIVGAGLLALALVFAWLVQDPGRWPFATLSGAFAMVGEGYAIGEVVSGRVETYHAPPQNLLDMLLIAADRFIHFFALGAADYSLAHWLISAAFLVPAYALAGWLLYALARGSTQFGAPERKLFLAAAGAVLAYAYFHALVQVDYDWRYRVPVLPHLILLAAGGAADLARRVRGA